MVAKPTYRELVQKLKQLEDTVKTCPHPRLQRRVSALWNISSMVDSNVKDICDMILEEIVNMTESRYGFYGFLNRDESKMTIYSCSEAAMQECRMVDKPIDFMIEESGIWGNPVRDRKPLVLNDYQKACPHKKGLPAGHVPIKRFLAVPIILSGRIVAIGGVSNKENEYTDDDIKQMTSFLTSAQVIIERQQSQETLAAAHKELEQRVIERTSELVKTNKKLLSEITARENISAQLKAEKLSLKNTNIALHQVMEKILVEKDTLSMCILDSLDKTIAPVLYALEKDLHPGKKKYIEIIRSSLTDFLKPPCINYHEQMSKMTPAESLICNMIKNGLTTKEIAEMRGTSVETVSHHREKIRKKLGLANKKVNLVNYLGGLGSE